MKKKNTRISERDIFVIFFYFIFSPFIFFFFFDLAYLNFKSFLHSCKLLKLIKKKRSCNHNSTSYNLPTCKVIYKKQDKPIVSRHLFCQQESKQIYFSTVEACKSQMMITLEEPTFDRIWSLTFSLLLELGISKPQLRLLGCKWK